MHIDPNVRVLAITTFSGDHDFWSDGCTMPVVWKKMYGKRRVFYSSLGHIAADILVAEVSRNHKSVKVQDLNCVQMRVSRCNNHYKFVIGARAKAKSVTNNLPILSVLGGRSNLLIVMLRGCLRLVVITIRCYRAYN
jgi:hypothetical protein